MRLSNILQTGIVFATLFTPLSHAALVDISADTLQKWITAGTTFDFLLIDIRDTSELTAVIATDACKPYHLSWNQGVLKAMKGKLPKQAHIVLYCRSGSRSKTAGQYLADSGYSSIYSLTGGINGWGSLPTMPSSAVKPPSELPAPSMLAASVGVGANSAISLPTVKLSAHSGVLFTGRSIPQSHRLQVFDIRGKLFVDVKDPFFLNIRFVLPHTFSGKNYIAILDVRETETAIRLCILH
jgi:rhodanese-related sulfurtransferase